MADTWDCELFELSGDGTLGARLMIVKIKANWATQFSEITKQINKFKRITGVKHWFFQITADKKKGIKRDFREDLTFSCCAGAQVVEWSDMVGHKYKQLIFKVNVRYLILIFVI